MEHPRYIGYSASPHFTIRLTSTTNTLCSLGPQRANLGINVDAVTQGTATLNSTEHCPDRWRSSIAWWRKHLRSPRKGIGSLFMWLVRKVGRCTIGLGWVILFYWLIFGSPVQFCRRKQWLPQIRNFQYYVQVIFPHCHAVGVRSSRQKCKYERLASQYIASAEWEASLRVRFWVLFI